MDLFYEFSMFALLENMLLSTFVYFDFSLLLVDPVLPVLGGRGIKLTHLLSVSGKTS